ncbi:MULTISPECIES: DUF6059 family protein [Streptomyces]|uniref:DUF6059 family protein n=1 Tax=Streptomyces TaxID=1883 RepID=UPI0029B3403F|nr:DUF6059 family protein [Streptomyces sp. WI03-4A]MDX2596044.1 hypothetical protein [Streptomyces sp. WI03-4A]
MARWKRPGHWRRRLGRWLRPVGHALMVHGGVDLYLAAADSTRAGLRGLGDGFPLMAAVDADGPPPGHPERLRPDLPLSPQEMDLLHDLLDGAPRFRR